MEMYSFLLQRFTASSSVMFWLWSLYTHDTELIVWRWPAKAKHAKQVKCKSDVYWGEWGSLGGGGGEEWRQKVQKYEEITTQEKGCCWNDATYQ